MLLVLLLLYSYFDSRKVELGSTFLPFNDLDPPVLGGWGMG